MSTALSIQMSLSETLAEALLQELRERLRLGIQEHWYSDEFRRVPDGMRTGAILSAYPALAAQKTTLGALQVAIRKQA
ncbi:hypothetical protein BK652_17700 [Pseudomonas brassicacearum]|uniref:Uncharacterized protein n=2 Tax=Pseudomonas TaxID=286 RepID=A0A423G4S3_9PSED|nr:MULTISPECIES: hypothetical protein [Pseudomonas]MBC3346539.1 hypothetical protein [Pseudomonas tehranensis]MCD9118324.1 hypothetical protein [Pseudomonas bijieensis]ROM80497.1 hypothetical protein BK652_17700 [Pseudomonas brassicacearum]SIR44066.1 hypothetical protein SAMN05216504_0982 [Pseudomonas sp. A214]